MGRSACCVSAKRHGLESLVDVNTDRTPSVKLSDATQIDEVGHILKIEVE